MCMDVHCVQQESMIIIGINQCVKGPLCCLHTGERNKVGGGGGGGGRELLRAACVRLCRSCLACMPSTFPVRAPVYYATSLRGSSVVLQFLHFDSFFFLFLLVEGWRGGGGGWVGRQINRNARQSLKILSPRLH